MCFGGDILWMESGMMELKPCPFCGGEAELSVRQHTDEYGSVGNAYCRCTACATEQPLSWTATIAVEHWNTRTPSTDWLTSPIGEVE
jgi:Lar family restriction alleviation protein